MAALPVGTVTLFYSEVENSTRLLQYLNARYPAVLEEHRAIVRAAISNHGGHEVAAFGDGLPLAIELAAPRIRLLPAQALLARLERRLPLRVGGAKDLPHRQQTLRRTIAWSHDLLGHSIDALTAT